VKKERYEKGNVLLNTIPPKSGITRSDQLWVRSLRCRDDRKGVKGIGVVDLNEGLQIAEMDQVFFFGEGDIDQLN
jgi:hypothetical protein